MSNPTIFPYKGHISLSNFLPLEGRWLADIDPRFGSTVFNILDPDSYPFPADDDVRRKISYFRSHFNLASFDVVGFDTRDNGYKNYFAEFLSYIRYKAVDHFQLRDKFPSRAGLAMRVKSEEKLPPKVLKDRLFFLFIAKLALGNIYSVPKIIEDHKLSKVNVYIWMSILLTWGEKAFTEVIQPFSPEEEQKIAEYHLNGHHSVSHTCAKFRIFTRNRLRHILHRHRPSPP